MKEYKDDCTFCIYLNDNGKCGCKGSIMYGTQMAGKAAELCKERRYYTRDAWKRNKKRRKIQSIYDYE